MKYTKYIAPLLFLTFLFASSCKDDKAIDCDVFQWGYEEEDGPEHWSECYPECGGQAQSPVNITGAVPDTSLAALVINYKDAPIDIINNGHTIQFQYEGGSSLTLEGIEYELKQFHFHSPSEHTFGSLFYPLEVHIVHQNAAGNYAVIGIVFETGNENLFLGQFIDSLPVEKNEVFISATEVNMSDLLPSDKSYFYYDGSLTTPSCSETVTWFVMKRSVELSASQMQKFTTLLHDNHRPVQPLNGRLIRLSE